jgi:mannose-6-phosphate isomerase-like protein (cupin superfamily)
MSTVMEPRRFHHPLQKDTITFLQTSAESDGRRTVIEIEVAPEGGNGLHRHLTYDERFEVLDGTLTVEIDASARALSPGESAEAPAGSRHCFRNETRQPVTFRVELRPGHEGFERALQAGYGLAEDGRTRADGMPRSLLEAAVLMSWSDIRGTGAIRLLEPFLGLLARWARLRGVDRRLAERYCAW